MPKAPTLLAIAIGLPLAACSAAETAPVAAPPPAPAAGPPSTDVFLLSLQEDARRLVLGRPRNLTDRAGYDNQPAFSPDGTALLYTSIRDDGQADIYRLELATGAAVRLTRTPESEYSPTPLRDGGFSSVRVEMDSTQRLWRFDARGTDPRLVLAEVRPVGYHAWGDEHTLALFVLGTPPTLQLADARTGAAEVVATDIGRSLNPVPGRRAISYVQKAAGDEWSIQLLDLDRRASIRFAPTLAGVEDHAWTLAGTLLMAHESRLYRWGVDESRWLEVADLAAHGVREITRLAVSPRGDRLALVAARQE